MFYYHETTIICDNPKSHVKVRALSPTPNNKALQRWVPHNLRSGGNSNTVGSNYLLNDYSMLPSLGSSTNISAPDQIPYQPKRRDSPSYIEISPLSSATNDDQRIHPKRRLLMSSSSSTIPTYNEALQMVEAKYSLPSKNGSPYPQQKSKTKITKSSSLDFTSHGLCRFAWS